MKTKFKIQATGGVLLLALTVAVHANEGIKVYTVAKEKPSTRRVARSAAAEPIHSTAAPVHWQTPSGWKELPPNSIRIGNFEVPGTSGKPAQVAITSFPGSVGTELENWNRWRRELNLPPTEESEITREKAAIGALEANLYDISAENERTVVAALPKDGATWFFKLRGDKQTVGEAKNVFLDFLKTVHFAGPAATAESATESDPHAGLNVQQQQGGGDPHANVPGFKAPENGTASTATAEGSDQLPQWNIPQNWTEKPAGMMVLKSYAVAGDKGTATVAISQFPGDVGGTLANVNRWRGQMGLAPIAENDLPSATESLEVSGVKATLVDLNGTDVKTGKAARMVAAMVPYGGATWFYKMTGDSDLVGQEKKNFISFLQTIRYP